MVSFVVEALPRELYTELMLGLTGEPTECGSGGGGVWSCGGRCQCMRTDVECAGVMRGARRGRRAVTDDDR